MNADIVAQARREEADLIRKLNAIRDLIAAYGDAPAATPVVDRPRLVTASAARERVEITSFTEQTRTSVVLAMQCMAMDNRLRKTRELLEFIEAMGHTVTGKNPVNALGALLARSVDVEGHGKSGWSLADREKALQIIRQYAPKQKEPVSEPAADSNAGGGSVAAHPLPWNQPSDQSAYS